MKTLLRHTLAALGIAYYATLARFTWSRSSLRVHQRHREKISCPGCGGDPGECVYSAAVDRNLALFDARRWARRIYGLTFLPAGRARALLRAQEGRATGPRGAKVDYHRCGDCDLFFQNTPIDNAARREYYSGFYRDGGKFGRPQAYRPGSRFHLWAEHLAATTGLPPGTAVLDVGCAEGLLVRKLSELGYDAHGIEPSAPMVRYAREDLGLSMVQVGEYAADSYPDSRFDLVTACHVIEHVEDPLALIHAAHRHLKPGGYLAVSTPCADAALRYYEAAGEHPDLAEVFGRAHYVLLTQTCLLRFVDQAGFEIIGEEFVESPGQLPPGRRTSLSGEKVFGVTVIARKAR